MSKTQSFILNDILFYKGTTELIDENANSVTLDSLPPIGKLHPYVASMTQRISEPIIRKYTVKDNWVLDPFSGAGNVLKTSALLGRNSMGGDVNPLASLISEVSTTKYERDLLITGLDKILGELKPSTPPIDFIERNRLQYWFTYSTLTGLFSLKKAIETYTNGPMESFFKLALSACIRKVSKADPKIPPPVYSKKMRGSGKRFLYSDVLNTFQETAKQNIEKAVKYSSFLSGNPKVKVYNNDSLEHLNNLRRRFDLILTSPPYMAAQKYVRSTSLELMIIFGLERRDLSLMDRKDIGSENITRFDRTAYELNNFGITGLSENQLILINRFLTRIKYFIKVSNKLLNPDGKLAIVIGDNTINGKVIPISGIVQSMAETSFYTLIERYSDEIRNYSFFTKRNKNAGKINNERVLIFQHAK